MNHGLATNAFVNAVKEECWDFSLRGDVNELRSLWRTATFPVIDNVLSIFETNCILNNTGKVSTVWTNITETIRVNGSGLKGRKSHMGEIIENFDVIGLFQGQGIT